jgi:hypothetical protein
MVNNPLSRSGLLAVGSLAPATAPANVSRLLATQGRRQVDAPRSRTVRPIRVPSKVPSVDPRMRPECSAGFRQLRTCRRTRPGQLCAHKRKFIKVRSSCSARDRQMLARHGVSAQLAGERHDPGLPRAAGSTSPMRRSSPPPRLSFRAASLPRALGATHRPTKTAARRSTNDLIPSFASSLFITRSRIFGTTAIAACSPASMNLRPASLVTWIPSGALR